MAKKNWAKRLKNTFIPHSRNRYKPHVTRHYGLAVILACLLLIQVSYNYSVTGQFQVLGYATNVSDNALLLYTNQNRASQGLNGYSLNSSLDQAAQAKAQHMVDNDYWSHYAPDGTTPWDFIDGSGYSYIKAGENLAYGFTDSAGVVQGWMDSPPHAANILDSSFTEVGFGIANGADFQGNENTVVVAMYGQPLAASPPVVQTEPEPESEPQQVAQAESTPAPEPIQEPEPAIEEAASIEEGQPAWTQKDLLEINQSVLAVESFTVDPPYESKTNLFSAVVSGQANWGIYASIALLGVLTLAYVIRHSVAIYQFAIRGEHYIEGHPLLEAGLVYGLLWLALASTYGVIG